MRVPQVGDEVIIHIEWHKAVPMGYIKRKGRIAEIYSRESAVTVRLTAWDGYPLSTYLDLPPVKGNAPPWQYTILAGDHRDFGVEGLTKSQHKAIGDLYDVSKVHMLESGVAAVALDWTGRWNGAAPRDRWVVFFVNKRGGIDGTWYVGDDRGNLRSDWYEKYEDAVRAEAHLKER